MSLVDGNNEDSHLKKTLRFSKVLKDGSDIHNYPTGDGPISHVPVER